MMQLVVDVLLPMAAIALLAMILHNPQQVNGAIATVTTIYGTGVKDIRA